MAEVYKSKFKLKVSSLDGGNALPQFSFQREEIEIFADKTLQEKDKENMFYNGTVPLLPYTPQEEYDRKQEDGELDVVVLENDFLKATVYPQYGGRLASIFDKKANKELLFCNPVFQPANLAIRNAWFSGGVEWNGPLYGHSLLTCSPVYTAIVKTDRGPVLRIYEFDRILKTTWQVDLFLADDSPKLYAHIKTRNLNDSEVEYYWWTNIAVPFNEKTRVLAPSTKEAIRHSPEQVIERSAFPNFDGYDGSYPSLYPKADSIFFDKPEKARPFVASIEENGEGLMHASTEELPGRKFFIWGLGNGGKKWMNELSIEGQGDYIEIQGGLTPTQLQTKPLEANGSLEWTECFMPFSMDADKAHAEDYFDSVACATEELDNSLPVSDLESIDSFMKSIADKEIVENLTVGESWGRLYENYKECKVSKAFDFNAPISQSEKIWEDFLTNRYFEDQAFDLNALSWNVGDEWKEMIEASIETHGKNWMALFQLSVVYLEMDDFEKAKNLLKESLELEANNFIAIRNLALIESEKGSIELAIELYLDAWAKSHNDKSLTIEILTYLLKHESFGHLKSFLDQLPSDFEEFDRVRISQAILFFNAKEYDKALEIILNTDYVGIREGEVVLTDLWFGIHEKKKEIELGRELSAEEIREVHKNNEAPLKIDYRMGIE